MVGVGVIQLGDGLAGFDEYVGIVFSGHVGC